MRYKCLNQKSPYLIRDETLNRGSKLRFFVANVRRMSGMKNTNIPQTVNETM